jgi:hypothetical protein
MGLIFTLGMTVFRRNALYQARMVTVPDKQCYDNAWNALLAGPQASQQLQMVAVAVQLIEARCIADTAAVFSDYLTAGLQLAEKDIARQYNRRRTLEISTASDFENDCGKAGTLDPARPLDCLDQLFAQANSIL